MATVSMSKVGPTHLSRNGVVRQPYLVEFDLDFSLARTAKGSDLAAGDVIEVLYLPANTVVLGGGAAVKVPGNSTTVTVNVGDDLDADRLVAGLDGKAAAGTFSSDLAPTWVTFKDANTIDVTLATLTGTLNSGVVRVYALIMDVSDQPNRSGLAKLGS